MQQNLDMVHKLNDSLVRRIVLPELSKRLGEEFTITIRRLTGKHIKLFEEMPSEVAQLKDADVDGALKTFPWLKRLVIASVVSPKMTDRSIGDHNDDEVSVDAFEADLFTIVSEVLDLSELTKEESSGDAFRARSEDTAGI